MTCKDLDTTRSVGGNTTVYRQDIPRYDALGNNISTGVQ